MVRPIETTILQRVRNVLFQSGREVSNVCIGEPGIFEPADVETELHSHHSEAINPQLHIYFLGIHVKVAAIADKEFVDRQMPDTNPSIGRFVSI